VRGALTVHPIQHSHSLTKLNSKEDKRNQYNFEISVLDHVNDYLTDYAKAGERGINCSSTVIH
jgi:hypothetical protein